MDDRGTPVREGYAPFRGHRTWYRVTGDLESDQVPLVVVHGGPAAGHDALDSYAELAIDGRPVVHYDQLGCGRSTRLPDLEPEFWTVELFLDELSTVLSALDIAGRYDLLGHSWGGILAAEHAAARPPGLASLVLANVGLLPDVMAGRRQARARLPEHVQEVLRRHEAAGTTDSLEYAQAMQVFYQRHLCRALPWPDALMRSLGNMQGGLPIINALCGSDFTALTGRLRDWDLLPSLQQIAVPTLCLNGSYEPVAAALPFHQEIPDVRWAVLPRSSHFPNIEERDLTMRIVAAFLDQHDSEPTAYPEPTPL